MAYLQMAAPTGTSMHSTAVGFACVIICGIGITPLLVETEPLALPASQMQAPSTVAGVSGAACREVTAQARMSAKPASGCRADRGTQVADLR
jgi:hypothetical protein